MILYMQTILTIMSVHCVLADYFYSPKMQNFHNKHIQFYSTLCVTKSTAIGRLALTDYIQFLHATDFYALHTVVLCQKNDNGSNWKVQSV